MGTKAMEMKRREEEVSTAAGCLASPGSVGAFLAAVALLLLAVSLGPGTAWGASGSTTRVSVSSSGAQAGGNDPAISADGRFVAFMSGASNLVAGDTNAVSDIFVHDRQSGTTTRVSVSSGGGQGNGYSYDPAISGDGRFVAFQSQASNLVTGDTNVAMDVFVHDRESGTTTRVSVSSGGGQADSAISESRHSAISGDGRYVAFESFASNLVAGDTNGTLDVFVYDRENGTTSRVSVTSSGSQGNNDTRQPAISGDGRYVAFMGNASNLVAGDTNGRPDVFVHDRQNGTTTAVSVNSQGGLGNDFSGGPAISADGRHVAFESYASNLVPGDTTSTWDVFIRDRQTGGTTRVASGGGRANDDNHLALSTDGRYVAFESYARDVVPGDTNDTWDVFVHDRQSGTTQRVSVDSEGGQGNNASQEAALSGDGRSVAFQSQASNLVSGDTNAGLDVFVHELRSAQPPPSAPTVALTDPVNAANQSAVTVSGTGEEGTTANISVDDGDPATAPVTATAGPVSEPGYSATVDLSSLSDGTLTATVTLTDAAGNTGPAGTATATKDTVAPPAPTVALTDPVNAANQSAATVSGTGEEGTTANISVDDEDPATAPVTTTTAPVSEPGYSATVDLSSLANGTLTATVTLTDAAGNTGPAGTATATKDTVAPPAPTVALADPVTPRNQAAATVSGTGEAGTMASISVDDGDPSTAPVTATVPVSASGYSATLDLSSLSNGTLTATVTLTDAAGNTGPAGTDSARKVGPPVDPGLGRGRP